MVNFVLLLILFAAAASQPAEEQVELAEQASRAARMEKNRILIDLAESPRSQYGKVASINSSSSIPTI